MTPRSPRPAGDAGVRARFVAGDATELTQHGPYDLVLILEALHDMAHPVDALAAARTALAPDGAVLVVDERVADTFTAPGDEVERMMHGWSVTHCLPTQLADQPSAALGTVMRAGTVRELAAQAAYARRVATARRAGGCGLHVDDLPEHRPPLAASGCS